MKLFIRVKPSKMALLHLNLGNGHLNFIAEYILHETIKVESIEKTKNITIFDSTYDILNLSSPDKIITALRSKKSFCFWWNPQGYLREHHRKRAKNNISLRYINQFIIFLKLTYLSTLTKIFKLQIIIFDPRYKSFIQRYYRPLDQYILCLPEYQEVTTHTKPKIQYLYGLFGTITTRKNLNKFLELVENTNDECSILCCNSLQTLSLSQKKRINALVDSKNLKIKLNVKSEAEFDSYIVKTKIIFLKYINFCQTSGLLTKALYFRKIIIPSKIGYISFIQRLTSVNKSPCKLSIEYMNNKKICAIYPRSKWYNSQSLSALLERYFQ